MKTSEAYAPQKCVYVNVIDIIWWEYVVGLYPELSGDTWSSTNPTKTKNQEGTLCIIYR